MKFFQTLFLLLTLPIYQAQAAIEKPFDRFKNLAQQSGYNIEADSKQEVLINIIVYALGFVGLFFLILIIISGFQWLNAGGNEDVVTKAKDRLKNAILGFGIIMIAYAITIFVNSFLKGISQ